MMSYELGSFKGTPQKGILRTGDGLGIGLQSAPEGQKL